MSQFGGIERPGVWETAGDHERRIRALEATPCCGECDSSGASLEDLLLGYSPAGLWKLDESSGTVAADSSGNGNDMNVDSGYGTPTWAQEAGPPGTQSALSSPGTNDTGTRVFVVMDTFTDNFSAGIWFNMPTFPVPVADLIGQGTSYHSDQGWSLNWDANGQELSAFIGTTQLSADVPATEDTWYLVGLTVEAGLATLYIDGVAQADTTTDAISANSNTWIANDGHASVGLHGTGGLLSWGFIIGTPLSAEQWAGIPLAAAGGNVPLGYVQTSDGEGNCEWAVPGPIDSTENVGESWGVHSLNGTTPEPEGYVLVSDGLGGSAWLPPTEVEF